MGITLQENKLYKLGLGPQEKEYIEVEISAVETRKGKRDSRKVVDAISQKSILEKIQSFDKDSKALTGKPPEALSLITNIPIERLLPKDKKILYVGEPWQAIGVTKEYDNSNFTAIDYETGEMASFDEDIYDVHARLGNSIENYEQVISDYAEEYTGDEFKENVNNLKNIIQKMRSLYDSQEVNITGTDYDDSKLPFTFNYMFERVVAKDPKNFPKYAEQWTEIRNELVKMYTPDKKDYYFNDYNGNKIWENDYAAIVENLKYAAGTGQRYQDIYDWETIVKPKLIEKYGELNHGEKLEEIRNITEQKYPRDWQMANEYRKEDLTNWEIKRMLEKEKSKMLSRLRVKKRSKESGYVLAAFPALPFEDKSFDRFVASWSISTHVMPYYENESEYQLFIDETMRVLKENGEAYIFPFNYSDGGKSTNVKELNRVLEQNLENSLDNAEENVTLWSFINQNGVPVIFDGSEFLNTSAYTLIMKKVTKEEYLRKLKENGSKEKAIVSTLAITFNSLDSDTGKEETLYQKYDREVKYIRDKRNRGNYD